MKNFVIVCTDYDWADECIFSGFAVIEKSKWEKFKEDVNQNPHFPDFSVGVGTNEEIEFSNESDIFYGADEIELTPEEEVILRKIFNKGNPGEFEFGSCSMMYVMDGYYRAVKDKGLK